jgi:hypothetical protein
MKECANRSENLKSCGSTYSSCARRGMCCECIRHHRAKNEIPGCLFPKEAEKTHDRSMKKFVESTRKG